MSQEVWATPDLNIPGSKRTTSAWIVDDKIQEMVNKKIAENPKAHERAQKFGEFLMNTRFANVDSFKVNDEDLEGNELIFQEVLKNIQYYGLYDCVLLPREEDIMIGKYGPTWRSFFEKS